jgi:ribonuclease Z
VAKVVILGTASAIPDSKHENTHLAVVGKETTLIDCVGTPTVRLRLAGIDLANIHDLVVTHFHPDHVSGVPLLLMNLWLLGRQEPFRIYGLHHCLDRLENMMASYQWENWPEFFPVAFHRLPERTGVTVLEKADYRILSSPVKHMVPTIGLRIEGQSGERAVAYSCDTEPTPSVVKLASRGEVLIHEASGGGVGHSTAEQAGAVASEAGVRRLLLIHFPTSGVDLSQLVVEAKRTFSGEVALAEDLMQIEL